MLTIDLTGIAEVTQRLQRLMPAPMQSLGAALRTEGNQIIRVANTLVPVASGTLRLTGAVEGPVQVGPLVTVTTRYGGYGIAPYAAIIETDPTINHPYGGQAHFLQASVFAATAGFAQRIAAALHGTLT